MENEKVLKQVQAQCVEQADMFRGVSMEVFLAISYAAAAVGHAVSVLSSFKQNDPIQLVTASNDSKSQNG